MKKSLYVFLCVVLCLTSLISRKDVDQMVKTKVSSQVTSVSNETQWEIDHAYHIAGIAARVAIFSNIK